MNKGSENYLEHYNSSKNYWTKIFKEQFPEISFIKDVHNIKGVQNNKNEIEFVDLELDSETCNRLLLISKNEDFLILVILTAILKALSYKYSGYSDIIVSTPMFNFNSNEPGQLVLFRTNIIGSESFKSSLSRVKDNLTQGYKNQFFCNEIYANFNLPDDILRSLVIILEDFHKNSFHVNQFKQNGLTFYFYKTNNKYSGKIYFNSKYYSLQNIQGLNKSYTFIANQVLNNLDVKIDDLKIITSEEKHKILSIFNATYKKFNNCTTISLFEECVNTYKNHVALKVKDLHLSYDFVDSLSDKLSGELSYHCIKSQDVVALLLNDPVYIVAYIWAIIKIGAIYLPINTTWPKNRIKHVIMDSCPSMILYQLDIQSLDKDQEVSQFNWINVEKNNNLKTSLQKVQKYSPKESDPVYIIYTSGTSGTPKGVLVEHGSLANYYNWRKCTYGLSDSDRTLQLLSYSFDGFGSNFYSSMLSGGVLVMINFNSILDIQYTARTITNEAITNLSVVPSLFNTIMNASIKLKLKSLKKIILGGERINPEIIDQINSLANNIKIINEYGPTETTIAASAKLDVKGETSDSIGIPMSNCKIHILNNNNESVPINMVGEICIEGKGVSKGYLNNPTYTSNKFIEKTGLTSNRFYKTGDIGKWLSDGEIKYVGRKDRQIKINGFRIELDEIEYYIKQYRHINEVVVDVRDNKNENSLLCAYYIKNKGIQDPITSELDLAINLRKFLADYLPEYSIPTLFIELDEFPLSSSGKIDRKMLSLIEEKSHITPPKNEVECLIAEIWSKTLHLNINDICINKSFFAIGGDSLKAVKVVSELNRRLNIQIDIAVLFENTTISKVAQYIQTLDDKKEISISKTEKKEYYPLSFSQKMMYYHHQLFSKSLDYSNPLILLINEEVNLDKLKSTIITLTERYTTLRSYFSKVENDPILIISDKVEVNISQHNIKEQDSIPNLLIKYIEPIDLQECPLFKITLLKLEINKFILIFNIHHILLDQESIKILSEEFLSIYNSRSKYNQGLQIEDYNYWCYKNALKSQKKNSSNYWNNLYQEPIYSLPLPFDSYVEKKGVQGEKVTFEFDKQLTKSLYNLVHSFNVTMNILLYGVYALFLRKMTGFDNVIINMTFSNRKNLQLLDVVGNLINTLPIKVIINENYNLSQLINNTKKSVLQAYQNQNFPVNLKDAIFNSINIESLFEISYLYDKIDDKTKELNETNYGLNSTLLHLDLNQSKSKLALIIEERDQILYGCFQYNSSLFKSSTITKFSEYFIELIKNILNNPQLKINDYNIISKEHEKKLQNKFCNFRKIAYDDQYVSHIFSKQAQISANKTALIFNDQHITYKYLDEHSSRLANYLKKQGVKANFIVAIIGIKSIEMITSILAIIKAGGGFLPINPDLPKNRILYMLREVNTRIIIKISKQDFSYLDNDFSIIEYHQKENYINEEDSITNISGPNDLLYVLFTSGTSGLPKGVIVNQNSLIALIKNLKVRYKMEADEKVLLFSNFDFDASLEQLFLALFNGYNLYITDKALILDTYKFMETIIKEEITHLNVIPSYFKMMRKLDGYKLRRIIIGGEKVEKEMVIGWCADIPVYNAYGLTETCITSLVYEFTGDITHLDKVPIGIPVSHNIVYVLDKNLKLMPEGMNGELYIGGLGLSSGYLNNVELTYEKFIKNPFVESGVMFKTGDLAVSKDGNICYLGRIDEQIKINGKRIELSEIDYHLKSIENINDAITIASMVNGGYVIKSYIIINSEITLNKIKSHLQKYLPSYMIPSKLFSIKEFPKGISGKIDKKKLLFIGTEIVENEYESHKDVPDNIANQLIDIWKEVLKITEVSFRSNFFDIGGNSINLIDVHNRMENKFEKQIPILKLFEYTTIKEISAYLSSIENDKSTLKNEADANNIDRIKIQERLTTIKNFTVNNE